MRPHLILSSQETPDQSGNEARRGSRSRASRCRYILQWPADEHFVFRLATVAFFNAAFLRYQRPESDCSRWASESDALDQLAEEHFRDEIRKALQTKAQFPKQVRSIFYQPTMPRAFASWMDLADTPTQAHWLVARATNLGLGAHLWIDDLDEQLANTFKTLVETEKFISTRLSDWETIDLDPDSVTPRFSVNDLKGRVITLQGWRLMGLVFELSRWLFVAADSRLGAGGAEPGVG